MQPRAPGAIPVDARNGARVKTQDVKPEGFYRQLSRYGHFGRKDMDLPWDHPLPL